MSTKGSVGLLILLVFQVESMGVTKCIPGGDVCVTDQRDNPSAWWSLSGSDNEPVVTINTVQGGGTLWEFKSMNLSTGQEANLTVKVRTSNQAGTSRIRVFDGIPGIPGCKGIKIVPDPTVGTFPHAECNDVTCSGDIRDVDVDQDIKALRSRLPGGDIVGDVTSGLGMTAGLGIEAQGMEDGNISIGGELARPINIDGDVVNSEIGCAGQINNTVTIDGNMTGSSRVNFSSQSQIGTGGIIVTGNVSTGSHSDTGWRINRATDVTIQGHFLEGRIEYFSGNEADNVFTVLGDVKEDAEIAHIYDLNGTIDIGGSFDGKLLVEGDISSTGVVEIGGALGFDTCADTPVIQVAGDIYGEFRVHGARTTSAREKVVAISSNSGTYVISANVPPAWALGQEVPDNQTHEDTFDVDYPNDLSDSASWERFQGTTGSIITDGGRALYKLNGDCGVHKEALYRFDETMTSSHYIVEAQVFKDPNASPPSTGPGAPGVFAFLDPADPDGWFYGARINFTVDRLELWRGKKDCGWTGDYLEKLELGSTQASHLLALEVGDPECDHLKVFLDGELRISHDDDAFLTSGDAGLESGTELEAPFSGWEYFKITVPGTQELPCMNVKELGPASEDIVFDVTLDFDDNVPTNPVATEVSTDNSASPGSREFDLVLDSTPDHKFDLHSITASGANPTSYLHSVVVDGNVDSGGDPNTPVIDLPNDTIAVRVGGELNGSIDADVTLVSFVTMDEDVWYIPVGPNGAPPNGTPPNAMPAVLGDFTTPSLPWFANVEADSPGFTEYYWICPDGNGEPRTSAGRDKFLKVRHDFGEIELQFYNVPGLEPNAGMLMDGDEDGDVDLQDFFGFQAAYTGPGDGCFDPNSDHSIFDYDHDEDVDLQDFLAYQTVYSGPIAGASGGSCGGSLLMGGDGPPAQSGSICLDWLAEWTVEIFGPETTLEFAEVLESTDSEANNEFADLLRFYASGQSE